MPLLGGGYGFGYITFASKMMIVSNIFDFLGDKQIPPPSITKRPILIYDLLVGAEFSLKPRNNAGERWRFTEIFVEGPVIPHNRYYLMGGPPRAYRRIDILKEEPDLHLSDEEAKKYPTPGKRFPPGPTAQVEVEPKRLDMSPGNLVKLWRESQENH